MFSHGNVPDGEPVCTKEKEKIMSMECDTRLSMMAMRDDNQHRAAAPRKNSSRSIRSVAATSTAAMASFALALFTRAV